MLGVADGGTGGWRKHYTHPAASTAGADAMQRAHKDARAAVAVRLAPIICGSKRSLAFRLLGSSTRAAPESPPPFFVSLSWNLTHAFTHGVAWRGAARHPLTHGQSHPAEGLPPPLPEPHGAHGHTAAARRREPQRAATRRHASPWWAVSSGRFSIKHHAPRPLKKGLLLRGFDPGTLRSRLKSQQKVEDGALHGR